MDAQKSIKDIRYNDAVFRAQECVEFAVKALLGALGVDYKPSHILKENVLEAAMKRLEKRLSEPWQVDQARLRLARAKVWMDLLGIVRPYAEGYSPLGQPSRRVFDKDLAIVATDAAGFLHEKLGAILTWL